MSKLQTSIQKAIEKSRQLDSGKPKATPGGTPKRRANDLSARASEVAGSIYRMFRPARPDKDIMKRSRIVSALDDPSVTASYNVLRTRILHRMRSNNWHSILVTSASSGEGKTLTASNLAVSLARDVNQSVILVDLDLRRSTVAKYLGFEIEVQAGIGDYLTGKAELNDIIYAPTEMDRIGIIPNREPLENASDLLGGPKMKELIAWLRNQAEQTIVIFDMPPLLAHDDVLAISPEIDAVLLVVAQGQTDREELANAMNLLQEKNILGVVMNKAADSGKADAYGY